MKIDTFTANHKQCLRAQVITEGQPGTVLREFGMLLDLIGPQGIEVGGKYNLLPLKIIGDVDERLTRPLRLKMKRPQIRSHPYLLGLSLLLRASGLVRIEKSGAKARMVLDPFMMEQWIRLNPTEQYFNLLEAWFRFGRGEMVGERGWSLRGMLSPCLELWWSLPVEGCELDLEDPQGVYLNGVNRDFYLLALMDLFGFLDVVHPSHPVSPWTPAGIRHRPFGDAFLSLLFAKRLAFLYGEASSGEENEDQDEEELGVPRFGAWQPLLQPYFSEWRENLKFPRMEPREGTFIFRVSLGKIWRTIAMPADASLDDLADWILDSVKFDSDHLYEFIYHDQHGAKVQVRHPNMDEGPWTDEFPVGSLPLGLGEAMQFHFDFGDDWRFTVKLERIEPPGAKIKAPHILDKHGKSPSQYRWEED